MAARVVLCFLVVVVPAVISQCRPGPPPNCQDWNIGADRTRSGGVLVRGHATGNLHEGGSSVMRGTVYGQREFGGPRSGAQTVGGEVRYQHNRGMYGNVDASHTRGAGTSYRAGVGHSSKVGPGTLDVSGGAATVPGSSRVQGQVGVQYSVPLP